MKTSRFNGLCILHWQDEKALENGLSAIGRDVHRTKARC